MVLTVMLSFHYRLLMDAAIPVYVVSLILLVLVIFLGKASGGQKNWLALGSLRIQPSEFAKLAVILVLAKYFSGLPPRGRRGLGDFLPAIALVLLPMALILVEKDLGSALFFALIGATFLFIAGIPPRFIGTDG